MKKILFSLLLSGGFLAVNGQNVVSLGAIIPPQVTATAGNDTLVQPAALIILNGQVSGGTAPFTYNWSPRLNMPDSTVLNPPVVVNEPTTFVLTVTDANNCIIVDSVFVDVSLSTEGLSQSDFKIYPNPARDHVLIETDLTGSLSVSMINMLGQEMKHQHFTHAGGELRFEYGNVPSGPYLLRLAQDEKHTTVKIIVE